MHLLFKEYLVSISKTLSPCLVSDAEQAGLCLVNNAEDSFSHDRAHIVFLGKSK